jgi:NTP pyrophosphatase (non-canonical NTP hydrolase)
VQEREWEQFHSPKNLSMGIAIEAAELMECFQWRSAGETRAAVALEGVPAGAVDELADVLIYCLAMANALQVDDLGSAVLDKLERTAGKYPAHAFRGRTP